MAKHFSRPNVDDVPWFRSSSGVLALMELPVSVRYSFRSTAAFGDTSSWATAEAVRAVNILTAILTGVAPSFSPDLIDVWFANFALRIVGKIHRKSLRLPLHLVEETLAPLRSEGEPEADFDDVASDVEGRFIDNFHGPETIALSAIVTHPGVAEKFLHESSQVDPETAENIMEAISGLDAKIRTYYRGIEKEIRDATPKPRVDSDEPDYGSDDDEEDDILRVIRCLRERADQLGQRAAGLIEPDVVSDDRVRSQAILVLGGTTSIQFRQGRSTDVRLHQNTGAWPNAMFCTGSGFGVVDWLRAARKLQNVPEYIIIYDDGTSFHSDNGSFMGRDKIIECSGRRRTALDWYEVLFRTVSRARGVAYFLPDSSADGSRNPAMAEISALCGDLAKTYGCSVFSSTAIRKDFSPFRLVRRPATAVTEPERDDFRYGEHGQGGKFIAYWDKWLLYTTALLWWTAKLKELVRTERSPTPLSEDEGYGDTIPNRGHRRLEKPKERIKTARQDVGSSLGGRDVQKSPFCGGDTGLTLTPNPRADDCSTVGGIGPERKREDHATSHESRAGYSQYYRGAQPKWGPHRKGSGSHGYHPWQASENREYDTWRQWQPYDQRRIDAEHKIHQSTRSDWQSADTKSDWDEW